MGMACPACGADTRHIGTTDNIGKNNHTNNLYKCGECGKRIVSG